MTTKEQLEEFYQFASDRMSHGGMNLSIDELYLAWRSRHTTTEELSESVAAVNAAYADFLAGDRGVPSREELREACRELGLGVDQ